MSKFRLLGFGIIILSISIILSGCSPSLEESKEIFSLENCLEDYDSSLRYAQDTISSVVEAARGHSYGDSYDEMESIISEIESIATNYSDGVSSECKVD